MFILLTTENSGLLDVVFRNPGNKKWGQFLVVSTVSFIFKTKETTGLRHLINLFHVLGHILFLQLFHKCAESWIGLVEHHPW
jgi:hypothetical protein